MKENNKYQQIYYSILVTGILLRVIQFLYNRSLWHDEAALALGLIDFNYSLFQTLPNQQSAPILFLLIERFFIILFGKSEYVLRIFPLICSIVSLLLFRNFAFKVVRNEKAVLAAFALFAFSPLLIYHSSELKQYTSDVLVFIVQCTIGFANIKNRQKYLWLAVSGVFFIFLSNIAVFVLAFLYVYLFFTQLKRRKFHKGFFFSSAVLLVAFAAYYLFFAHEHPYRQFMLNYWQNAFMPLNPFLREFWEWHLHTFSLFFKKLFFGQVPPTWFIIFLTGFFFLLFSAGVFKAMLNRNFHLLYILLFPVLLHLTVSALKLYPFHVRLVLYLSPLIFIGVALGGLLLYEKMNAFLDNGKIVLFSLIAFFAIFLFLNLNHYPIEREEIKQSLKFIETHKKKGDKLVVAKSAKNAFAYYIKTRQFNTRALKVEYITLEKEMNAFTEKYSDNHGRYWFLFSHNLKKHQKEISGLIEFFRSKGYLIHLHQSTGSMAILVSSGEY